MVRGVLNKFRVACDKLAQLAQMDRRLDEIKINQGRLLSEQNQHRNISSLEECEFKIFSQWGEDGIIQYLISKIDIRNRTFIEFGVEDFHESNCRYLMMKDNWRGFDPLTVRGVAFWYPFKQPDNSFVPGTK